LTIIIALKNGLFVIFLKMMFVEDFEVKQRLKL